MLATHWSATARWFSAPDEKLRHAGAFSPSGQLSNEGLVFQLPRSSVLAGDSIYPVPPDLGGQSEIGVTRFSAG